MMTDDKLTPEQLKEKMDAMQFMGIVSDTFKKTMEHLQRHLRIHEWDKDEGVDGLREMMNELRHYSVDLLEAIEWLESKYPTGTTPLPSGDPNVSHSNGASGNAVPGTSSISRENFLRLLDGGVKEGASDE